MGCFELQYRGMASELTATTLRSTSWTVTDDQLKCLVLHRSMASDTTAAGKRHEEAVPGNGNDEIVYSTFSKTSKRWILIAASFSAMFSGLSSFIYYPAITPIAEDLHT